MELRPYQQESREAVQKEWEKGNKRTLLVLPTGCHAENEELLKYDGSIEKVQNIKASDYLIGADGLPRIVLNVQQGIDQLYLIKPVKGKPFTVTGEHKLTLVRTNEKSRKKYPSDFLGGQLVDVTVNEWIGWSKNKKHIHKLIRSNAIKEFDGKKDITIDPYFLGVLLGDGDIKNSISITTMDKEIVKEIEIQCQKYNMTYRTEPTGKALTYIFKNTKNLSEQLKKFNLRKKGAYEKSVPFDYKTAPLKERLEVIAGLIDTDGSYSSGGYDFISASKRLSEDLVFMCRSVGLAAYVKPTIKSAQTGFTGIYYRVSISGDCTVIPCRVEHKKPHKRTQIKNVLRTGFSIESKGIGKYYGFTVDKDNRYLMSDFTITHNCGKTIVFSKIIEDRVRLGERVLVLAHRGELLEQASDKLEKATGLKTATEKAEETSLGSFFRVVVGSVQTLQREKRLNQFAPDYFDSIVVDEAHHCISDGYQRVLKHFENANVLGVTATADRGDQRNLGEYFQSLAYDYSLPAAIKDGYLTPIKALTIPLKLDISGVKQQTGDFSSKDLGTALDPYLEQIADEMVKNCMNRKTVVFLPLVKTSKKFRDILNKHGFRAGEVNGESNDRKQVLADFEAGKYNVLCNSMLLTEGWDCPSVDCVVVLRPTKVRALYSQMVGRGTRLAPGKTELLLLDFLWHTERLDLCHPAHLITKNQDVAKKMTENIEEAGMAVDLEEAEQTATEDVVAEREESLAKQLAEMKRRKRKLVDPLQFEMSIQAEDLANYVPAFGYEMAPPTDKQKTALEKMGIFSEDIDNAGKAELLLNKLSMRRDGGFTTPKQIRFLESRGFQHVGTWKFENANKLITRIAANGWRIPQGVKVSEYNPETVNA
ncbi:DEAD/DEAH box helicase family protein [Liquorilactobacillus hordei]|uniref:DEAD/DEAH box helicase family protein n=1 Tax=Liquorilactobacillus hordei TaxID=468911 RepID=UPI0037C19CEA|nr:helicase [Liquorilactobacillus hordei]